MEGIVAVKQKLTKSSTSMKVILSFLKLILLLNNFVFNSINFLKKKVALWALNGRLSMQIFL